MSDQWLPWIMKAGLAAGAAFGIGTLTMGLPGTVFVSLVNPNLHGDSVWPAAVIITQVGALLIVPASLALRLAMPNLAGWRHAQATALLAIVATLLFAIFVSRQ